MPNIFLVVWAHVEKRRHSHEKTFTSCFEDTRPFDRIPKSTDDFKLATKVMVEFNKK